MTFNPTRLPDGVRARRLTGVNGLDLHLLEAGAGEGRPLLLLLHGFPELAYSWRHVMAPLAAAGWHVVAPDQRGYGHTLRSVGSDDAPPGVLDWVGDVLALTAALGHRRAVLVGHDFGAQVAGAVALIRPDVVSAVVLMSSPFVGAPAWSGVGHAAQPARDAGVALADALAALPEPRRHYQHYFASSAAASDLVRPPQGLRDFLRAYFHAKSADVTGNHPAPLDDEGVVGLARLPTYYVMRRDETMPQTVAAQMPSADQVRACTWLTEDDLEVYVDAFSRTGFQDALQFYRCRTLGWYARDLQPFAGRRIEAPAAFLAGRRDWGPFQRAGDLDRMRRHACARMGEPVWIDDAGHWVQQEQPQSTAHALLDFLATVPAA